ncbi:hypothetical protein J6590_025039 [Homalodisca vitripennis]|nr:hypothetical protein J6590_025039 [Homalodisca vitripennis]
MFLEPCTGELDGELKNPLILHVSDSDVCRVTDDETLPGLSFPPWFTAKYTHRQRSAESGAYVDGPLTMAARQEQLEPNVFNARVRVTEYVL